MLMAVTVNAQEDVTSTYLKNSDFSSGTPINNHVCTYGKDMEGNGTTYYGAQPITDWTNASVGAEDSGYKNSKLAGAIFTYGSESWLAGSGNTAPATDPEGNAGNAAGLCAVWGGSIQYTQAVTFPAGSYTVKFYVYNTTTGNGNSSGVITTNLFGFVEDGETTHYAPNNTFAIGQWSTIAVTFNLDTETTGKISMGYGGPSGNAAMPHLFVDKVQILKNEVYEDCTSKVSTSGWTGATDGYQGGSINTARQYGDKSIGRHIYQTVSGLENGSYEVTLYSISQKEWNGTLANDAGDVAYVFAEGAYELTEWINARARAAYPGDENLGIYTISGVKVTEGTMTLGMGLAQANLTEWHHVQIKSLVRTNAPDLTDFIAAYNTAKDAAKAVDQTQTMAPSILTALQNAISTYETVDETSQSDLEAATAALNAATAAANTSIASYAIIASRTVSTDNLAGWTCTNSNDFHVNTWSIEGNTDGTGMTTPFIENWRNNEGYLGEGTISYTLKGLEPGEVYYAQALIRAYSESGNEPNGPNFFINDVETDMKEAGTQFTFINQYNNTLKGCYATLGGAATVTAEGTLTLGAKIASDANYNWVAFKNVSIQSMDDALAAAVEKATALNGKIPAKVYDEISSVITTNNQKWSTATDYETAIGNITNAVVAGTKFVEPYANFNAVKEQAQALLDESSSSEGRDELEDAYNTQIAAVENVSDWTDDDVEIIATATNALYAAIQLFLHPDYLTMEGTYYVEHVETSTYMATGHDWGTRGIVNNTGLDLTLTANADRTVNFDTQVSNGGNNHFLGANLYMDSAAKGWIIEMAADDTYTISTIGDEGTQYIGVDENDNLVLTSEPTEWRFIDAATRIEELEAASSDYGMDATFLLKDPNFNRNDQRVNAWTVSEDCNNETLTLSGGNDLNNCAGSLNSTFDIYQTVSGAPAGVYELTAQGFYRQDGEDTEAIPYFYANGEKAELSAQEGSESDMSGASASFTKGLYTIEPIKFHVGEDGVLTVGIKNETAVNQWIVFDNFQLTYYGSLITLDEKEDNTAALDELDGQTVNVTLTRTLQTGGYNSFAVPFDISAETLADMGITAVKELESSSYDKENGTLTLNFETATSIEAGKPYLVKVSSNVVNPTFYGVTISNTAESIVTDNVDFIPTLGSTTFSGSDNEKNFLYIGEGNKLYNPASLSNGMKGFRAYFYLKDENVEEAPLRVNMDFGDGETTGIIEVRSEKANASSEGFYDLMGRSVQGLPTQKGVYIKNGKKVIVK